MNKLIRLCNAVNSRYNAGKNDDDQVLAMLNYFNNNFHLGVIEVRNDYYKVVPYNERVEGKKYLINESNLNLIGKIEIVYTTLLDKGVKVTVNNMVVHSLFSVKGTLAGYENEVKAFIKTKSK